MSRSEVVACYRLYAVYCVEIAQHAIDPGRKVALLDMAQSWTKLADQIEKNGIRDATALPSNMPEPPGLDGSFTDPVVRLRIGTIIARAANRPARPKRSVKSR
jgi:hypothetical protein